jgi:hypothetical protein
VARRQLLTEEERRLLFGIPHDPDALTRHYSFTRSDRELLTGRRRNANRLGFAVQLALLRHPGIGLVEHRLLVIEQKVVTAIQRVNVRKCPRRLPANPKVRCAHTIRHAAAIPHPAQSTGKPPARTELDPSVSPCGSV